MEPDPLIQALIPGFLTEAKEICQRVTRQLLTLERAEQEPAALAKIQEDVARGLHTLKGSAATLALDDVSKIAHRLEDLLNETQKPGTRLSSALADTLLKGLDLALTRTQAHAGGSGGQLPEVDGELATLLQRAAGGEPRRGGKRRAKANPAPAEETVPSEAADPEAGRDGPPATEEAEESEWRVGNLQVVGLMGDVERLREAQLRLEERQRDAERCLEALEKLGLKGDAVQLEALLVHLQRSLQTDHEEVSDVVNSLEEGIKEICTRPVATLLDPLHRAVRDLCRASGKEAKLSAVGAEVSLDRRVLDALRGPITHLVRNAVDHGIEDPQTRQSRGKHREGAIVIRVEQQGNLAFVEVSDDGNGLALDAVRDRAVALGLLTADQREHFDSKQALELVFRAGFSTRQSVSEISGRGVGLDVVKTQLEALSGRVEVQSTLAQGTRFTLTIPTKLGSAPLLIVGCGEQTFGLPTLAVEMVIPARSEHLRMGEAMRIEHREQLLPLWDLGVLLGLRHAAPPSEGQPVLIVQSQGKRHGVLVDSVLGDRDMTIRPLPPEVRSVAAFQGAATLARGELMLILRPDWLTGSHGGTERLAKGRTALVVDDSLTVRALHRSMLEAGGFRVHVVPGAREAFERLRRVNYDVIVCDVGMEGMDGLTFTKAVRANEGTRHIPVVLVSARDGAEERARGYDSGADLFISKKECAAGRLLAQVQGLVLRKQARA